MFCPWFLGGGVGQSHCNPSTTLIFGCFRESYKEFVSQSKLGALKNGDRTNYCTPATMKVNNVEGGFGYYTGLNTPLKKPKTHGKALEGLLSNALEIDGLTDRTS